jgi:hypothetical protein
MSASVGTTQQLGIGIGKFGSAVFAVVLAAVVAASLLLGVPSLAKPAAPAAGLAAPAVMDHGSRIELGAPALVPNANYNDHGSRGEFTTTAPKSFGGWNGPRTTAPVTGGSNGPRLRAQ